jgi:peptidoglycan/LPS O-acetylase OafA/YrhL
MKPLHTLGASVSFIALSAVAFVAWVWLFYASPLAQWWQREYLYAGLVGLVAAALVSVFLSHRRKEKGSPWLATGITLVVCILVAVAVVAVTAANLPPWTLVLK